MELQPFYCKNLFIFKKIEFFIYLNQISRINFFDKK